MTIRSPHLLFAISLLLVSGCAGGGTVRRDPAADAARQELYQPAVTGDKDSQYEMGMSFEPEDRAEATKWLCAAAKQGHGGAQMALADLYSGSRDPDERDPALAVHLYRLAASHSVPGAKEREVALRKSLEPYDKGRLPAIAYTWPRTACTWSEIF